MPCPSIIYRSITILVIRSNFFWRMQFESGTIDTKGMDVAQPIWLWGCVKKAKKAKNAFLAVKGSSNKKVSF